MLNCMNEIASNITVNSTVCSTDCLHYWQNITTAPYKSPFVRGIWYISLSKDHKWHHHHDIPLTTLPVVKNSSALDLCTSRPRLLAGSMAWKTPPNPMSTLILPNFGTSTSTSENDDIMTWWWQKSNIMAWWKHIPLYWPFVNIIHWGLVSSIFTLDILVY